jgi:hypothetical protein
VYACGVDNSTALRPDQLPITNRTASPLGKSALALRIQPGRAIIRHRPVHSTEIWHTRITHNVATAMEYTERYLANPSVENSGRRKDLGRRAGLATSVRQARPARLAEFESHQVSPGARS